MVTRLPSQVYAVTLVFCLSAGNREDFMRRADQSAAASPADAGLAGLIKAVDQEVNTMLRALSAMERRPADALARLLDCWTSVEALGKQSGIVMVHRFASAVGALIRRSDQTPMHPLEQRLVEQAVAALPMFVADLDQADEHRDTRHLDALLRRIEQQAGVTPAADGAAMPAVVGHDAAALALAVEQAVSRLTQASVQRDAELLHRLEQLRAGDRQQGEVFAALRAAVKDLDAAVDQIRDRLFALGDAVGVRLVPRSGQIRRPGVADAEDDAGLDRELVASLAGALNQAVQQMSQARNAVLSATSTLDGNRQTGVAAIDALASGLHAPLTPDHLPSGSVTASRSHD